jgi:choline dehydrogenase-like flavoprotein
MATSETSPKTDFSRDVLGRYICNGLDEANASADSNSRPDARPFDIIVIGGGTFGAAIAEHLWFRGTGRAHRILVLEGGPFVLPEHVQNLPVLGLDPAGATTINELRQQNNFGIDKPRKEVWGLPWQSGIGFPGLAYCVGGRSLYWGGWSPELLDSELPSGKWPAAVLNDLKAKTLPDGSSGYFQQASDQIGVSETNDFIFGDLHKALRNQLYKGIGGITNVMNLNSLPDHPTIRFSTKPVTSADLAALLGLDSVPFSRSKRSLKNELKLEAPLAVQGRSGHAGFFPSNKFSTVPLLIKAAREAYTESGGDDAKKRLMVVPYCHINHLTPVQEGKTWRVGIVETNLGSIQVPPDGKVIIALGTIESARLARESFKNILPANDLDRIGRNLMAHLRSNLAIRIPRQAITSLPATVRALQASALFVKGQHQYSNITESGHFHLQITASGLGPVGANSEAELFKKVPDIDLFYAHLHADDTHVVITIRGIGEMEPMNPNSHVTADLNPNEQEFGVQRAYVTLTPTAKDMELWAVMDKAADDVARIFANGHNVDLILPGREIKNIAPTNLATVLPYTLPDGKNNPDRRDGLGTTHHEAGPLWMGDDPRNSVSDANGRLHQVKNAYVLSPALFPTIGSPNPMLTGIALARRMGDHLMPPAPLAKPESGFKYLFDGTGEQFSKWKFVGGGNFILINRAMIAQPGGDIGLLYYEPEKFENFVLRLDFLLCHPLGNNNDNSGVFVRFRDPLQPVPDPNNPGVSHPYNNQAYVAVDTGFEVQIDDEARGNTLIGEPDGFFYNRTGAIYKIEKLGAAPGQQDYKQPPTLAGDKWHQYEIEVNGNTYIVRLNGQETTKFIRASTDTFRGNPPSVDAVSGYVGIQSHTGTVAFANAQIKTL